MDIKTKNKLNEMKENREPLGCLGCLSRLDDDKHEYDNKNDIWYCPAMSEK